MGYDLAYRKTGELPRSAIPSLGKALRLAKLPNYLPKNRFSPAGLIACQVRLSYAACTLSSTILVYHRIGRFEGIRTELIRFKSKAARTKSSAAD